MVPPRGTQAAEGPSAVTEQPSQPTVEGVPQIGDTFTAKRPDWMMSDDTWAAAVEQLGDLWFDLHQRAAREAANRS